MASKIFLGLIVSAILYFLIGPGPYQAQGFPQLGQLKDYSHLIKNPTEVDNLHIISHPNLQFPQDLLVEGPYIYTGGYKGKVYQLDPTHEIFTVIVQSAGQIMRIIKKGSVFYFLDVEKGICRYDTGSKKLEVLVSGSEYKFLDSFDISDEGVIYFSDASSKYGLDEATYDIYEGKPYGSLWSYDINTKKLQLLLGQLYFANGVELSPDQSIVYVAETGRYRVRRYYLKGEKKGQTDILIDNLPGVPDNLRFNQKGELWIAQPVLRDWKLDYVMKGTFVRNLFGKLPLSILLRLSLLGKYSGGIKVDENGKVLEFLRVPAAKFNFITTVMETNNTLYLGTIHHNDLGMIPRKLTQ